VGFFGLGGVVVVGYDEVEGFKDLDGGNEGICD